MKNILIATEKPFAAKAVSGIKEVSEKAGYKLSLLEKYTEKKQLLDAIKSADALIVRSDKITEEIINNAPKLKVIVRAGAGYDNIDLEAASKKSVVVMNTPGQNSNAVAELTIGMMIFLARNKYNGKAGNELRGKNIGIHAYGNVGRGVATLAKGFGMNVYAFDPFVSKEAIEDDDVKPLDSLDELYQKCNYISLHIPANEKTKKSINYELLMKMPEDAVLINTARKEIIDEEGILKVMEERKDFGYISDIAPDCKAVFEEKYPDRHFFTPKKMGAQTAEANINAGIAAINQIIGFFEDDDITFQVNK